MAVIARIRALTKAPDRLQKIANNLLGEAVATMDIQLDQALDTMQTEPGLKPGSRYVRTHTYRDSWERSDVRLTGSGLVGTLSSDAVDPHGEHYTAKVGGDEQGVGQLEMHKETGWPLVAEALRGFPGQQSFRQRVRKAVHKAVEG